LKNKTLLAASFAFAFTALPVAAQSADLKVGYVDTQRIFRTAPAAVKAAKDIEAEFSKRDQELQRMAKRLQTMQETAARDAPTLSESQRRSKEREFEELTREFNRKQREFREDLNLRQNDVNAAIIEQANKAIKQIANSEKFDLILQDAVWVSPKLDITDKVVKALGGQ
jgi:outer membrane protein